MGRLRGRCLPAFFFDAPRHWRSKRRWGLGCRPLRRARTLPVSWDEPLSLLSSPCPDGPAAESSAKNSKTSWMREADGSVVGETVVTGKTCTPATSSTRGAGWRPRISLATVSEWAVGGSSSKAVHAWTVGPLSPGPWLARLSSENRLCRRVALVGVVWEAFVVSARELPGAASSHCSHCLHISLEEPSTFPELYARWMDIILKRHTQKLHGTNTSVP